MDIATLAAGLAGFLAPLIPALVAGAGKAAEKIGQELGEKGWEKAKALWDKLRGRLGENSAAVKALAEAPEDEDAQVALRVALKQVLKADSALADELAALLSQANTAVAQHVEIRGSDNVVAQGGGSVAAGHGGVAVGGSVSGSVINTGDRGSDKK
ncbi:MAG: hypothetical protein U9Q81_17440 [Pseudomonadota bacterium]|nr:hypothetical protein [Pseudomonadota bacterium]